MQRILTITVFLAFGLLVNAQGYEDQFKVDYDTPLTIDLEKDEIELEETVFFGAKKKKKNVFYGLQTRKGYTKTIRRRHKIIEQFRFLKEFQEPDEYAQNVYWFDFKKAKIVNSRKPEPGKSGILHGPYKKMVDDQVVEQASFYKGLRHGRRLVWNTKDILQVKENWYKGWPRDAKVDYYNKEKKELKEVIPYQLGELSGDYYKFFSNGIVQIKGKYELGQKIGSWKEYQVRAGRRKIKKIVNYPKKPFMDQEPYVFREWNKKGKLIYDFKRDKNKPRPVVPN